MKFANQYYSAELGARGQFTSLKIGGKELLGKESRDLPLFTVCLFDHKGEQTRIFPTQAPQVTSETAERMVFRYEKVGGMKLDAEVTACFPKEDALTYWRIKVENHTGLYLEWIEFPALAVPNDLKATGGDSVLLYPVAEGGLIEDIDMREKYNGTKYREVGYISTGGWRGIYPGTCQLQLMAYYSEKDGKGLYMAAHDSEGNVKGIEPHKADRDIQMEFRLFPGTEEEVYEMPYDMVVGVFEGDWHDAADIYRNWFENSGMAPAKLIDNHTLPEWYENSPITLIYPVRGEKDTGDMTPNGMFPYIKGSRFADMYGERTKSSVMPVLMHWEGTAPWAPPKVWPPFGGEEALREYMDHLHENGNYLGVYCSGIGWTTYSYLDESYNEIANAEYQELHIADVECHTRAGKAEQSLVIGPPIREGVDVCSHSELIQDIACEEVRKMAAFGLDYAQYFDQNMGGLGNLCYAKDHGHVPMPGKWMTDDMKRLYEKMQKAIQAEGSQMLLGCEACAAEPFIGALPYSDARFCSLFYFAKPVPLYSYVYHEYLNNFTGNQCGIEWSLDSIKNPSNCAFRLAHSFAAGNMLSLVLNHDGRISWGWGSVSDQVGVPNQEEMITLAGNLNQWRIGLGKAFLFSGRMAKPVPISDIPDYALLRQDGTITYYPGILYTKWKSEDGREAQFLVNFRSERMSCRLQYEKDVMLYREPGKEEAVTLAPGERIELSPLSAVMVVF